MTAYDQSPWDLRLDWGEGGLLSLKALCRTLIVVDVLSFSTSVDLAVARGCTLVPCHHGDGVWPLSPARMEEAPPGARLRVGSPNGAALSLLAGGVPTAAACLRNRSAVARWAVPPVGVVAAGERWADGTLRPCLEDLLGAGALLEALPGRASPEAEAAVAVFRAMRGRLEEVLATCASGREKGLRGEPRDVALAAALDVSDTVPVLVDGAYTAPSPRPAVRSRTVAPRTCAVRPRAHPHGRRRFPPSCATLPA